MIDYKDANNELKEVYANLSPIVSDIVSKHTKNIDNAIGKLNKNSAETITTQELLNLILELQIEEFYFSTTKDMAVLKQECAVALEKTSQAEIYNSTEGTQTYRQNKAINSTVDKDIVRILYTTVANALKTKYEETHRMIGTLNSILISRNVKAKSSIQGASTDYEDTRNNID
jgi:hypothetical protein